MTTPITPESFTARGVDATTAVELARQHNEMIGIRSTGPAVSAPATSFGVRPTAAPPAPKVPPAELTPNSEAIAKRMRTYTETGVYRSAEQIARDLQVEAQMDEMKTHGVRNLQIAWNKSTQDEASAHDQSFGELLEREMAPAASAADYRFPETPSDDEAIAVQAGLRAAMLAGGLPIWAGTNLAETINRASAQLAGATPEQIEAKRVETQKRLEKLWGADYPGRTERLRGYLKNMGDHNPAMHEILEYAGELIDTDWEALETLSRVVEYQSRKPR